VHRLALTLLAACATAAPPPAKQWPLCPATPHDRALATSPIPFEIDANPATTEVALTTCGDRGLCTWILYARRDLCWFSLGEIPDVLAEPHCVQGAAPGSYCDLLATHRGYHGEELDAVFTFDEQYRYLRSGETRGHPPR
jgi:hypothetical protein